ncbi:FadR/GntR family transcriptional regulator [Pararobbsia silviterrae]|nr:FCD domain-containing protein [Pararobbsia silviterrae]
MLEFQPVKSKRVSDEVEDQIRRLLVAGDLQPGDKLPSERDLALQLGVGRNALREALRSLEMAGVVELRKGPKGGSFVTHGTTEQLTQGLRDLMTLQAVTIEQITEARNLFEQAVVQTVCRTATEDDWDQLEQVLQAARDAYARKDYDTKLRKLVEFHIVLAHATHNPVLVFVMKSIMDFMLEYVLDIGPDRNDLSLIAVGRILDALRARDARAASHEMSEHLERLNERYMGYERRKKRARRSGAAAAET